MKKQGLKEVLTEELRKLLAERDGYRAKSIQYKEAAEKVDKQVNRLQHFLSDYDSEIDVPDEKTTVAHSTATGPRGKHSGITTALIDCLETYYPEWVSISNLKDDMRMLNLNPNSVASAVLRFHKSGKVESIKMIAGVKYRLREAPASKAATKTMGVGV